MILKCDECDCHYETDFDNHDIGEPNWCCEACAWENSHSLDELKPPHTCKSVDRDYGFPVDAWQRRM